MSHELPGEFTKDVVGYCVPLSLRPGEDVAFKLSSYRPGPAEWSIVELISGDDRPHGTGLIERGLGEAHAGVVEVDQQALTPGSFARIEDMPEMEEGVFEIWVYPTLLREVPQCIASLNGLEILIDESGVTATNGRGQVRVVLDLVERRWLNLRLAFGVALSLAVEQSPGGVAESAGQGFEKIGMALSVAAGTWHFASAAAGDKCFNGRLEAPVVTSRGRVIAAWDFAQAINTQRIVDTSGNARDGELFQTPTRAVKGRRWDGTAQSYHTAPEHYAAIHFHEDDFTDAGWQDSLVWRVPDDLASGQYACKVVQGESEDYIPFFVRPPAGERGADVLYLVPTATYLAYANQRLQFTGGIFGEPTFHHANDAFLYAHEDVGFSLYEYHRDGSGVHFSSRLRPILNMKPRTGTWAFNADTHITAWLHEREISFDVMTDEDLHVDGAKALSGYRVVITGTHPEYYSTSMRDGLSAWLGAGGRLMYMGGNGFYWRIAHDPDNPGVIEVRRAEDGTRAWMAEPGEYYHQFGGEYGGLWRRLGKPPNELVGIGFAAQGFDGGTYYRVQEGALDPRAAFIVEGVDAGEQWGSFGNQGGGAAGEEIDRWDVSLGSPRHAVILASSENHRPGMLRVKEEFHMTQPLGNDPKVRADMVFFEVPGGGAVFSTGSISYAGSLAHNNYDNEIARLTENVLRRFLDPEPFAMPGEDPLRS